MKESKIFIAAFLSSLGSSMYFVIVAWMLYEMTSDAKYTGLMVGLGFLPGIFMNMIFGIWVDRANRKRLSIIANTVITVSMAILTVSLYLDIMKPWLIITVHMSVQTFSSLFRTAQQAFITEVFDKKHIPRIFSHNGSAVAIGGLLGTSLGGFAISYISASNVIFSITATYVIVGLFLSSIKYDSQFTIKEKGIVSLAHDLLDSFRYIHRNPIMYGLLGIMFVGQLVVHTTAGMLSVYTSSHLNGSSTLYGILESAASIGAIIAGLTATLYLAKSKYMVAAGALSLTAIGILGMALTKNTYLAFSFIMLIGIGTTWVRVLMQSIQQVATEPEFYGRMAATRQTINQASVAIGAPLLGFIADHSGIQMAYIALLVPVGILLFFSQLLSRNRKFQLLMNSIIPIKESPKPTEAA
ncbi:hypothetical protein CVD28_22655 [Bacillus sp. M6-12]|uniref:MFS transporter n=1 Tax=Bacillus sp. M6-12 TaxID=2054166 RepID=UPI000C79233A|nr:MFS transporter [Bacillus sp. M6-12]PLS15428.1 hypothetical protein CVD28_22655 [Bacillus sp. M6-12]